MEIFATFVIIWIIGSVMLTFIWSANGCSNYQMEFLWWPIWLVTVGLMKVLKSMKRAIVEEWNK